MTDVNPVLTYGLWGLCVVGVLVTAAIQGSWSETQTPAEGEPQAALAAEPAVTIPPQPEVTVEAVATINRAAETAVGA
jgi:hypothetical protein